MAARSLALATALVLGLTGLAQAQARSTWQEPGQARGTEAPVQQAQADPKRAPADQPPRTQAPAATQAQGSASTQAQPRTQQPRAEGPRPRARAERRPRDYRSARYRGGEGASWRTGRDAYGFMGSYGGCSYRGNAGPNGYRLDRRC